MNNAVQPGHPLLSYRNLTSLYGFLLPNYRGRKGVGHHIFKVNMSFGPGTFDRSSLQCLALMPTIILLVVKSNQRASAPYLGRYSVFGSSKGACLLACSAMGNPLQKPVAPLHSSLPHPSAPLPDSGSKISAPDCGQALRISTMIRAPGTLSGRYAILPTQSPKATYRHCVFTFPACHCPSHAPAASLWQLFVLRRDMRFSWIKRVGSSIGNSTAVACHLRDRNILTFNDDSRPGLPR
ncbi:hypothetical protein F4780DRAFT_759059 [Xylariomycetidae sp. FL0641]|nr:hypothetical protein F4780DRAFT_759059 [Xylariomycetidae sp. FL0641]